MTAPIAIFRRVPHVRRAYMLLLSARIFFVPQGLCPVRYGALRHQHDRGRRRASADHPPLRALHKAHHRHWGFDLKTFDATEDTAALPPRPGSSSAAPPFPLKILSALVTELSGLRFTIQILQLTRLARADRSLPLALRK